MLKTKFEIIRNHSYAFLSDGGVRNNLLYLKAGAEKLATSITGQVVGEKRF